MRGFTATDFLQAMARASDTRRVWDALVSMGIPEKVMEAHAETLTARGDWEYGVSLRGGWVTEQGKGKAGWEAREASDER